MEELDGARVERVGDGVEEDGCRGVFRYGYALVGAADAQGDVGLLPVHFCELCEFFDLVVLLWRSLELLMLGASDSARVSGVLRGKCRCDPRL